jgi:hypothetical protein
VDSDEKTDNGTWAGIAIHGNHHVDSHVASLYTAGEGTGELLRVLNSWSVEAPGSFWELPRSGNYQRA